MVAAGTLGVGVDWFPVPLSSVGAPILVFVVVGITILRSVNVVFPLLPKPMIDRKPYKFRFASVV